MSKKKNAVRKNSNKQPERLLEFGKALMDGISMNPEISVSENPERSAGKSVFICDLRGEYRPDAFAKGLLRDTCPEWMPTRLRTQMEDALRGLDERMAVEIADDLLDCWSCGVRHYIGIQYIDRMLNSLYNKILWEASRQGVHLPMHF